MTKTLVLPPGVPLELYDALPKNTLFFDGEGQSGNWADPANWWGGTMPAATSLVVVPVNATLNGSFTAATVMFLGNETVTVNGALTTMNPNLCESFMVCDEAVAVFNPGASLNVAGSLVVGNDDDGTLLAKYSGSSYATITSAIATIGRLDAGNGTFTVDGAHWANASNVIVGLQGSGTLNILDNAQVAVGGDLTVGYDGGATGQVTLSSGATLTVHSALNIGSGLGNPNGEGVGQVTLDVGSVVVLGAGMNVFSGDTLTMAGGTLQTEPYASTLDVHQGGTVSGYGTITATTAGVVDSGTIVASGGTLMVNGQIGGVGTIDIAAGSTLDINGTLLAHVGLDFTGAGGTLQLAHGITDQATISGFSAGDSIVMQGLDHIAWNAVTDTLALSYQGQVVDKLHFAGTYTGNPFVLSQSSAGAVITLGTH